LLSDESNILTGEGDMKKKFEKQTASSKSGKQNKTKKQSRKKGK
jgi:hypothetical protein